MPFWSNEEKSATHGTPSVAPVQPLPEVADPIAPEIVEREETPNSPAAASDLLLGRGARFEGKLTFEGTVRIDANFMGTIITNDVLVVGEAGHIKADITCGTIVVYGEVDGNIRAKDAVEIHTAAKVRGELETPSLIIEKGALFQGASRMNSGASAAPAEPAN